MMMIWKDFDDYLIKLTDEHLSYVCEKSQQERMRRGIGRIDACIEEIEKVINNRESLD